MDEAVENVDIQTGELIAVLYAIVQQQSEVRIPADFAERVKGKQIRLLVYKEKDELVFEMPKSFTIH